MHKRVWLSDFVDASQVNYDAPEKIENINLKMLGRRVQSRQAMAEIHNG